MDRNKDWALLEVD